MARLKMEWKAQMRSKQQTAMAQPNSYAAPYQHQPAVSGNCIDLTIDDDSEEDDEPLVPTNPHPQAPTQRSTPHESTTAAAAVCGGNTPSMNSSVESAHVSVGNSNIGRIAPEAEPVESDVDEEWPHPAQPVQTSSTGARAPRRLSSSLSFSDVEEQESEEDEELPKRVAGSPAKRATVATDVRGSDGELQVGAGSEQAPSADVRGDDGVEASDAAVANAGSAIDEGTGSASPAISDAATSQGAGSSGPAAKKDDADEHLEDGEIFEEGAVIASPTKVKQAIALERLASRVSGDSETASPQRQKKQKKRGKKKSKRKLDAMMLLTGDGSGGDGVGGIGAGPEFERNTRHHPFLPTAMLDQHMAEVGSMMPMYGSPQPPPPGTAGYGTHPPLRPPPPPHLHMHGGSPMPPLPPQFAGPLPPFADDQILRVNRHGNVEMFNSNVEYPRGMPAPAPLPPQPSAMLGGFKYRSVPPHPSRAPDSVRSGSSTCGSSSNQSSEQPGDDAGVSRAKGSADEPFDLDSLRAAALRTKRLSKTVVSESEAKADAVMPEERSTPSPPTAPEGNKVAAEINTTPTIDELRAEILRSMMKKKAARPVNVSAGSSLPQPPPRKSESGTAKVSSPVSVDQQQQQQPDEENGSSAVQTSEKQKTPSPPPTPAQEAAVVDKKVTAPSPSPTTPSTPPRVDYSSLAVSTAATFATPKFRPLTASSQSIVICLSPEDYAKSSKTGDSGGASSSSGSSTIQSAIDEMRKKIAEKEKLRKENRSGIVSEENQKNLAACNVGTVPEKKIVENGNGRQTPENNSILTNAEAAKKNIATRSSLQAKIEEMKKKIAAKEMEKSNNGASSSTSSSTRASATSSPRERLVKKPTTADTPPAATTATNAVESLSREEHARLLDQQQQVGDIAPQLESTISGADGQDEEEGAFKVLPKQKLDEYQKLYSACVADYEEARNQVATLDDAIAKLRGEIASMEATSVVSPSG